MKTTCARTDGNVEKNWTSRVTFLELTEKNCAQPRVFLLCPTIFRGNALPRIFRKQMYLFRWLASPNSATRRLRKPSSSLFPEVQHRAAHNYAAALEADGLSVSESASFAVA